MAWYDQDDSDIEKYGHRLGAPIQQGAQDMGHALDAKMNALQKLSGGSAAGPGLKPQMAPQAPMPGGSAPMGGGGDGPMTMGTMDDMAAQRQKLLDMYNGTAQETQQANQEPDLSGFKPFQNLKSKIQDDDEDDMRGSTRDTGTRGGV